MSIEQCTEREKIRSCPISFEIVYWHDIYFKRIDIISGISSLYLEFNWLLLHKNRLTRQLQSKPRYTNPYYWLCGTDVKFVCIVVSFCGCIVCCASVDTNTYFTIYYGHSYTSFHISDEFQIFGNTLVYWCFAREVDKQKGGELGRTIKLLFQKARFSSKLLKNVTFQILANIRYGLLGNSMLCGQNRMVRIRNHSNITVQL